MDYLVNNWRDGWKWFSNWALALIVFMVSVPMPVEVLEVLSHDDQLTFLRAIAILGLILRFVRQPSDYKITEKQ